MLNFQKYYERVFYMPRNVELDTVVISEAPILEEIQILPNNSTLTLRIERTGLRQFPQGLKYLAKLNWLHARENQFTQLTLASFSSAQRFSQMHLNDNKINLLIDSNHTVSIVNLDIGNNQLTTVNMAFFGQITNLLFLNLANNRIIRVYSTTPVTLPALKYLALHLNILESLRMQAVSFPVLQTLSLRRNNLTYIPQNLTNYPALELLDLGENKLTLVDLSSIRQVKNLVNLNLDRNMITSLSASSPLQHDALRVLNVDGNKLVQVNFTGCIFPSLRYIYAGQNNLTGVPSNVFQLFPTVVLYMPGNPTSCDSVMQFKKQLLDRNLVTIEPSWTPSCPKNAILIKMNSQVNVCCIR
ncbi:hypothetical protein ZHAS_00019105 [Anopheles sinensis]|uniref:Uncharacterized protein n=1 Tax=Anopheles sinensis TaxID=74873 RepID=A0A084WLF8_ANOSI|nr:hypothetical protein ZHAS_00019105 [Anopheles sinensis]